MALSHERIVVYSMQPKEAQSPFSAWNVGVSDPPISHYFPSPECMFANNPSNIKIPLNWTKQGNPEAHICKERGPTLSEIYHKDEWIIAQNPSDHYLCWWRRELGQAYQVQNPSWRERWCLENQISSQPGRSERRWLLGQREETAHLWVVRLRIYIFILFIYLLVCLFM